MVCSSCWLMDDAVERGVGGVVRDVPGLADEAHEAGVLDASGLRGHRRREHALGGHGVDREARGVATCGDRAQQCGGRVGVASRVPLSSEHAELRFELVAAEGVVEVVQDVGGALGVFAERSKTAGELLAVEDGWLDGCQRREGSGVVDGDSSGCVDRPRAEPDAGPMALADPAHAHDEPEGAERCAGLVGVLDDARVAQRRGLDGVLVSERRPQQQPALRAEVGVRVETVGDAVGVMAEGADEVAVAASEPTEDVLELAPHVVLVEGEDPRDDAGCS